MKIVKQNRDESIDPYYLQQMEGMARKGNIRSSGSSSDSSLTPTDAMVDSTLSKNSINAVENKAITYALEEKVNKEEGKGLTSNDFTDSYKNMLDNVDTEPTNSQKLITSQAVYQALSNTIDTSQTIELECVLE